MLLGCSGSGGTHTGQEDNAKAEKVSNDFIADGMGGDFRVYTTYLLHLKARELPTNLTRAE